MRCVYFSLIIVLMLETVAVWKHSLNVFKSRNIRQILSVLDIFARVREATVKMAIIVIVLVDICECISMRSLESGQ